MTPRDHAYYRATVASFLAEGPNAVLGALTAPHENDLEVTQRGHQLTGPSHHPFAEGCVSKSVHGEQEKTRTACPALELQRSSRLQTALDLPRLH